MRDSLKNLLSDKGQTAVEYFLLLTIVAIVVLIGLKNLLPRSQQATELFYNRAANSIMSNAPVIVPTLP